MAPQTYHEDKAEWITRSRNKRSHGISDDHDKKLELRLGPPGDQDQAFEPQKEERNIWLSNTNTSTTTVQKAFSTKWSYGSLTLQSTSQTQKQEIEPKPSYNSAAPNSSEKSGVSTSTGTVVGWPPVRSFRKNVAKYSSFSKLATNDIFEYSDQKELADDHDDLKAEENINSDDHPTKSEDHKFVKINMEGVPIGRKVDLNAYDSYHKLSYAIDQLFRGLLAAQRDYSVSESTEWTEDAKAVTNGEYTLVYEDNEGDRILVGDVPWEMFVSTAKRLRVLRSLELSTLKLSSNQIEKTPIDSTMGIGG